MNKSVYINRIAGYLPGDPVSNDEMEQYLGFVGGNFRSKSKALVLRNNKITTRYYAIDKEGKHTHNNAQLTAEAIRRLESDDFRIGDIQLLTCGTTSPDQLLPSHASMVHGELKSHPHEAISFSGSCCSGMNALKYAYMSIASGNSTNAVTTGSEKLSHWMQAGNFREEAESLRKLEAQPYLAFEKDFLRWMLSDGAAAVLLSDHPNKDGVSLRIEWMEISSFANEMETCMYFGGEKQENGELKGWAAMEQREWLERSIFALRQDTRMLEANIARLGTRKLAENLERHNVDINTIDWYLPHISSEFFRAKVDEEMKKNNIYLPQEKWFINLSRVGNIGSASIFLALEELFNSGKLKKGERIILSVPESARFAYANALLTVC
jgi:3-oxoacyl-[acyl-carrier-protein] synthase III